MKTMMINSLVCVTLGMGAMAYAGNEHSHCDMDLNYGLKITPDYVEFLDGKDSVVKMSDDNVLMIDGKKIGLSSSSKKLLEDYQDNIRKTVPEVGDVAIEAVELAERAVSIAFKQAFNLSEEVLSDLSVLKEDLVKEIAKHFHAKDGSFFIDAGHVEKNIDPFTHDLEQRFEATVEKIVEQSIGAILMQIGKEIVSSEGDMTAFGQRMEKMGENIEHAVEKMAENVEGKMDSLCGKIEKLDHLENALYKEVPEFEGHDLINLKRS